MLRQCIEVIRLRKYKGYDEDGNCNEFFRESGAVKSWQRTAEIPIPSEPGVPKVYHPVGTSRGCCVNAQKLSDFEEVADYTICNLSGTASAEFVFNTRLKAKESFEAGFCYFTLKLQTNTQN